MHHDKQIILWPEGEHPSLEMLRQYQQGSLPVTLQHPLERHVLGCALCADVLEGMELSDERRTRATVALIKQRIRAKLEPGQRKAVPYWQVAAAILVLVCSAVLVLYYNLPKEQPQPALAKTETQQESINPRYAPLPPPARPEKQEAAAESIAAALPPKKAAPAKRLNEPKPQESIAPASKEKETIALEQADGNYLADISEAVKSQTNADSIPRASIAATSRQASKSIAESSAFRENKSAITIRGVSSLPATNQKQVTGRVVSPEGEPLPGVVVMLKDKSAAAITGPDGIYRLPVPADTSQTLRFSFIGYYTKELPLAKNETQANVVLAQDTNALSEVVVTGYGHEKTKEHEQAQPVIGWRKYKKYLQVNQRPVPEAGKVKVNFTITADGTLQDLRITKSLCPACDAEALRLVQEGPAWQAATKNGLPVSSSVKVSVRFRK
ncbi:energy transducer TonB [Pontibacter oryzae]|uniref:TonB family protein n=1 Tax=Pontibacter oryzae TaxID=2304593 RepID=A0A399RWW8_9BACT|nr:TonB family protein [Pontibacter oryzae]RIJ34307.1 TonB family protein [Pontibacter oryzae]